MGVTDHLTGKPIAELTPLELLEHLRCLPGRTELDRAIRDTSPFANPTQSGTSPGYGDWWGPTREQGGGNGRGPNNVPFPVDHDSLDWQYVTSSNVRRIAYQADFHRLFIEFHSGAIYSYENFEPSRWEDFLASDSKGMFVYYIIRGGGHDNAYAYDQLRAGMSTSQKRRPWF